MAAREQCSAKTGQCRAVYDPSCCEYECGRVSLCVVVVHGVSQVSGTGGQLLLSGDAQARGCRG